MENVIVWVVGLVALAGIGWLGWVSVQSLRQAAFLRRVPKGPLRQLVNQPAAFYGRVRVTDPIRDSHGAPCLWSRTVVRERRGWGRNRRWVTVADETHVAGFVLEAAGDEVDIVDQPTEVQGAESHTEYDSAWFATSSQTSTWLPVLDRVTVLGRVEQRGGRWVLARDATLGLLLSPHSPEHAASTETWKGVGGLVGIAALVGF
jgi:hypothetical protein